MTTITNLSIKPLLDTPLDVEEVANFARSCTGKDCIAQTIACQLLDTMRSLEFVTQKYQEEMGKTDLLMRELAAVKGREEAKQMVIVQLERELESTRQLTESMKQTNSSIWNKLIEIQCGNDRLQEALEEIYTIYKKQCMTNFSIPQIASKALASCKPRLDSE